jgi:hypothetical protein
LPQTIKFEGRSYTFPDDATDDEIAEALDASAPAQSPAAQTQAFGPLGVVAADAGRRGAVYAAEQVATSPATRTAVRAATSAPVRAAIGAAAGGWPGAVIGQAMKLPVPVVERGVRGVAGVVANVAGSSLARAATGPIGTALGIGAQVALDPEGTAATVRAGQDRQEADFQAWRQQALGNNTDSAGWNMQQYIDAAIAQLLAASKRKAGSR